MDIKKNNKEASSVVNKVEKTSEIKTILDEAKLFCKNWSSYEYLKSKIVKLNLKPDDYEKAIKKLTDILEL